MRMVWLRRQGSGLDSSVSALVQMHRFDHAEGSEVRAG